MTSLEFEPALGLKDYISSYWYYRVQTNSKKYFEVLPDAHFGLVFTLEQGHLDAIFTGLWTKPASIFYENDAIVFGVSFYPIATQGLLHFNVSDVLDDLNQGIPESVGIDKQVLLEYMDNPNLMVEYLNTQFSALLCHEKVDLRLKKSFDLVHQSNGNLSVNEISDRVGISPRQLHKLVKNMLGVGLKEYSKIIRFKKTLAQHKSSNTYQEHYYDQSHFIREVKRYADSTPQEMDLKNDDRFIQYFYF